MILRIAWKSLVAHPVRTAVLGVGFGLGVSVMAILLGVGQVVLQQAQAPALVGGGDVVVSGLAGPVTSARFLLNQILRSEHLHAAVTVSPQRRAELFLVRPGRTPLSVRSRGGIPSLERAMEDPETANIDAWVDTAADRAWSSPDAGEVLRAMDRFHTVPDVPARAHSWAEWLYFKGQSGPVQFYLTFLVGPKRLDGKREAGVRLQLDRDGRLTTYSDRDVLDEASLLAAAPNITIGRSRVELHGMQYRIALDLPVSSGSPAARGRGVAGQIVIQAVPGRSLAPIVIRGAGGWISGYVVPVMSGVLSGSLEIPDSSLALSGTAYHDHNWGFWEGVTWRWGQVQHEGRSYVYGRVFPPADAADPDRVPGFLVALGPTGVVGYATNVTIEETDDPSTGRPYHLRVSGRGEALDLTMAIDVERAIVTRGGALAAGPDFLQLRGMYRVSGRAGNERVEFVERGAAETFRQ